MASSARIDELRKKFDENPRRYFAPLANEYRKAGDIDQAIAICREYLPQQPGHMSGHIVFGQALYEARQFEEAKSVFETALTLDPENLIALRHLGDISLMLSDNDGARSWYRRVLEADPRNEEIQAQLASLDQAASGAPTPVVGAPAEPQAPAPPAPAKPTPSSAPTVVVSAVPRPQTPAATPTPPPSQPVTAVSPTAEIVLDEVIPAAPKSPAPPTLEIDTGSLGTAEPQAPPPEAPALEIETSSLAPAEAAAPSAAPLEGLEATSAGAAAPPLDSFSLEGLETTSMAGEAPSAAAPTPPQASTEPAAPPAPAIAELDLDIPSGPPAPTAPPAPQPEAVALDFAASPPAPTPPPPATDTGALDLDLGSLGAPTPPAAEAAPTPTEPAAPEIAPLEFDVPATLAPAEPVPAPVMESLPEPAPEPLPVPTLETLDEIVPEPTPAPEASAESDASPFVTETMAELYLQQGHREEALKVYRQLAEQRPDDARLRDKVASLSGERAPAVASVGGESMRQLLRRVALRRPGHRVEAPAETRQNGSATAPVADTAPTRDAPSAPASAPTPSEPMSDALGSAFGFAAPAQGDEHAALALAAAFSSNGAGGVSGRPAHAAGSELSLDSVFGGGQQAPSAPDRNFKFDQFFSPRASAEHPVPGDAAGGPASESAHDVAQFNQWLEGLKGR